MDTEANDQQINQLGAKVEFTQHRMSSSFIITGAALVSFTKTFVLRMKINGVIHYSET